MADKKKKMVAALAAVNAFLQDEEALAAAQQKKLEATPLQLQNNWSQSGRQEIMNMRRFIQMRAFQRCR